MSKHTPGPWIACEYGGYGDYEGKCRVVLGDGGDIRTAVVLGFDTPENDANARLIAAAPELLAVLQELEESARYWSEYDVPLGIVDRISAAIAKATGEEA